MESKVNIAKAIIKVMQAVKGMEKNSRVGKEGSDNAYNGTKDQDVKEVFNEALAINGLCIMPINIEENTQIDRWEEIDQWSKSTPKATKQKQSVFTKVKVKYLLLHDSGESIELMGYGHGVDSQDKGAGKATTYALKNCLLYTFLTPVGKIDDTETTHSEEIQTPKSPEQIEHEQFLIDIKKHIDDLGATKHLTDLETKFKALDPKFQKLKSIIDKTNEMKTKLTPKQQ